MKIVIFGATGRTGLPLVQQALEAGHQVTAFVRDPSKLMLTNLRVIGGSVTTDAAAVEAAINGQDAVLSALGPMPGGTKDMMKLSTELILAAMQKTGVKRLISLTGAGVAQPGDQPKLINKFISLMLGLISKEVLLDSSQHARLVRASNLDWTIVRVPMLTDAPATGKYRIGLVGINDGMRITRSDVAKFMLECLSQTKHLREAPVVSS